MPTGPIEQLPPPRRGAGRPRGGLDRALTTVFIGALVVAMAVSAFIYGRSRVDDSVTTNPAVSSSSPIVLPESTSTSTTVRRGATTTSTTEPPPSDTLPVVTVPNPPVTIAPRTPPSTASTVPATTATTAPAATGAGPTNP